jgi:hypothetical protein
MKGTKLDPKKRKKVEPDEVMKKLFKAIDSFKMKKLAAKPPVDRT